MNEFCCCRKFTVIDLETTGLNCNPANGTVDNIIEVGAVRIQFDDKGGYIDGDENYSTLVSCPVKIPAFVCRLTGIKDEDLHCAPALNTVLERLHKMSDGTIFIGHNLPFNYGFLSYYGNIYGRAFPCIGIDTLDMAKVLLKDKVKNYKLSTLAEYFGIEFNCHRALDDATATAKIFLRLLKLNNAQYGTFVKKIEPTHCDNVTGNDKDYYAKILNIMKDVCNLIKNNK